MIWDPATRCYVAYFCYVRPGGVLAMMCARMGLMRQMMWDPAARCCVAYFCYVRPVGVLTIQCAMEGLIS